MQKFTQLLLGSIDLPTYSAYFIFALIGAIISLRIKANNRNKLSQNTPVPFSWKFLLHDNLQQLVTGVLLTFLAFRFSNEFLGKEITMWAAVFIGAGNNELAGLFEKIQGKARK